MRTKIRLFAFSLCTLFSACAVSVLGARYYRLLENERTLFLGLRAIDSTAAMEYLYLESAAERRQLYDRFWQGKESERPAFEERTMYAFRNYGSNAPLTDDRIPVYIKYGPPSRRQEITPQKMIGISTREIVRPAEIWTYRKEGQEFDFIRIARAYKQINRSEFGDAAPVFYFKEDTAAVPARFDLAGKLEFTVGYARFRQKKNLTRLEVYINIRLSGADPARYVRSVAVRSASDSVVAERRRIVVPVPGGEGVFYDEVNLWLPPEVYRLSVELADLRQNLAGRREFTVDLLEYAGDAKEISDLVAAKLIDESFTDERFDKPVGRVIPMTPAETPVYTPFYFYHEVYNLQVKDGQHQLRTTYEIYNKLKMKKEIVDALIQDEIGDGDIAHLAAKYHPMDLPAGEYMVVARDIDLIAGRERSAVGEFKILGPSD